MCALEQASTKGIPISYSVRNEAPKKTSYISIESIFPWPAVRNVMMQKMSRARFNHKKHI